MPFKARLIVATGALALAVSVLHGQQGDPQGGATFRLRLPKHFYVSPFSDVDVAFDFTLRTPGEGLSVQIDDYAADQRTLGGRPLDRSRKRKKPD